jgi:hypothetical protein
MALHSGQTGIQAGRTGTLRVEGRSVAEPDIRERIDWSTTTADHAVRLAMSRHRGLW